VKALFLVILTIAILALTACEDSPVPSDRQTQQVVNDAAQQFILSKLQKVVEKSRIYYTLKNKNFQSEFSQFWAACPVISQSDATCQLYFSQKSCERPLGTHIGLSHCKPPIPPYTLGFLELTLNDNAYYRQSFILRRFSFFFFVLRKSRQNAFVRFTG
jgi:hypothetical protein